MFSNQDLADQERKKKFANLILKLNEKVWEVWKYIGISVMTKRFLTIISCCIRTIIFVSYMVTNAFSIWSHKTLNDNERKVGRVVYCTSLEN